MAERLAVSGIGVYPVKSLRGLSVDIAELEPWGFAGDRRWMVVDPEHRWVTQRATPAMALVRARFLDDGRVAVHADDDPTPRVLAPTGERLTVQVWRSTVPATGGDPEVDAWLSERLARPVRLVHLAAPGADRRIDPEFAAPGETVSFADGYPVLVANRASLDEVNSWQHAAGARTMTMARFRPSIVIDGATAWAEDAWSELAVGDVRLRLVKPCTRCVLTAVDPRTGTIRPGGPLRRLGQHRGDPTFGVNAIPSRTGRVRVGDEVRVLRPAG